MGTLMKLGKIKNLGLLITGGICIAAPITVMAAPNECADWIAKVVSTEGRVETRLTPETAWQSVALNQALCPGSVVHTQAHSRAALLLRNNTVLRLSQKSTFDESDYLPFLRIHICLAGKTACDQRGPWVGFEPVREFLLS